MFISNKAYGRRIIRQIDYERGRAQLQLYRQLTLWIWLGILGTLVAALAWTAGTTTDWDALIPREMLAGLIGMLYREIWLIRWSRRSGAPFPYARDPWEQR